MEDEKACSKGVTSSNDSFFLKLRWKIGVAAAVLLALCGAIFIMTVIVPLALLAKTAPDTDQAAPKIPVTLELFSLCQTFNPIQVNII